MASLVTVASFNTSHEAALAVAQLESNGVHAVTRGAQVARLYEGIGNPQGTIDVQVLADDEDAARSILAMDMSGYDDTLMSLEAEHSDAPERESLSSGAHCPHCGSENFFVTKHSPLTVLLSLALLGFPLLFIKRKHECAICATTWDA